MRYNFRHEHRYTWYLLRSSAKSKRPLTVIRKTKLLLHPYSWVMVFIMPASCGFRAQLGSVVHNNVSKTCPRIARRYSIVYFMLARLGLVAEIASQGSGSDSHLDLTVLRNG